MKQTDPQFKLRIPAQLKDDIERSAEANNRSMNAEIVTRLENRTPTASIPPFGLRMQPELKAQIEEAARANNRSMNSEIVSRLSDKFMLRLPGDMRDRVKTLADRNDRSMNTEIVARLADSLDDDPLPDTVTIDDITRMLAKMQRDMTVLVALAAQLKNKEEA